MASNTLFNLPVLSSPTAKTGSGTIACTEPSPKVYLLTFNSPPDNRLTTAFCQTLLLALDILEFSYPRGVVVTTSAIQKFYSNGLDLDHAINTKGFWTDSFFALLKRFLTYPMPTIALLNGHAFAGGIMLSMYHDYRIGNPSRGFFCLNELDLGVPLKPAMSSIFRQKLAPQVYNETVLEAKRFSGKEAFEKGIFDGLGGLAEVEAFVRERNLTEKAKTGVYGLLKKEMWRETLEYINNFDAEERKVLEANEKDEKASEERELRVREWEKNATKAKL